MDSRRNLLVESALGSKEKTIGNAGGLVLSEDQKKASGIPDLALISGVVSQLNRSTDLYSIMTRALAQMGAHLAVDGAALFLMSETTDHLELKSNFQVPELLLAGLNSSPKDLMSSPGWRCALSGKPTRASAHDHELWPQPDGGLSPCCFYPLDAGEGSVGILLLMTNDSKSECAHEFSTISQICKELAIAIEKTKRYERTYRKAQVMESLYLASVDLSACLTSESVAKKTLTHAMRMSEAERGALFLVDRRGSLDLLKAEPAEFHKLVPKKVSPQGAAGWILGSRCATRVSNSATEVTETSLPSWHEGSGNYLGVPLISRGRTIGILELAGKKSDFTLDDQKLIETLTHQVAVTLENMLILEETSNIADILQRSLLPHTPKAKGLDIGTCYASATATAAIGGDFYDFLEVDNDRIAMVCGDVCGKGVEAAATTAMVRYLLHSLASNNPTPASVTYHLNRALCAQLKNSQFVTMHYALYDRGSGKLEYTSCGHPPALLWGAHKETEKLATGDLPLGLFRDHQFKQNQTNFELGDSLLLYTDGVTESKRDHELFGEDRLLESFEEAVGHKTANAVARSIYMAAHRFSGGSLSDDLAIVAVCRQS